MKFATRIALSTALLLTFVTRTAQHSSRIYQLSDGFSLHLDQCPANIPDMTFAALFTRAKVEEQEPHLLVVRGENGTLLYWMTQEDAIEQMDVIARYALTFDGPARMPHYRLLGKAPVTFNPHAPAFFPQHQVPLVDFSYAPYAAAQHPFPYPSDAAFPVYGTPVPFQPIAPLSHEQLVTQVVNAAVPLVQQALLQQTAARTVTATAGQAPKSTQEIQSVPTLPAQPLLKGAWAQRTSPSNTEAFPPLPAARPAPSTPAWGAKSSSHPAKIASDTAAERTYTAKAPVLTLSPSQEEVAACALQRETLQEIQEKRKKQQEQREKEEEQRRQKNAERKRKQKERKKSFLESCQEVASNTPVAQIASSQVAVPVEEPGKPSAHEQKIIDGLARKLTHEPEKTRRVQASTPSTAAVVQLPPSSAFVAQTEPSASLPDSAPENFDAAYATWVKRLANLMETQTTPLVIMKKEALDFLNWLKEPEEMHRIVLNFFETRHTCRSILLELFLTQFGNRLERGQLHALASTCRPIIKEELQALTTMGGIEENYNLEGNIRRVEKLDKVLDNLTLQDDPATMRRLFNNQFHDAVRIAQEGSPNGQSDSLRRQIKVILSGVTNQAELALLIDALRNYAEVKEHKVFYDAVIKLAQKEKPELWKSYVQSSHPIFFRSLDLDPAKIPFAQIFQQFCGELDQYTKDQVLSPRLFQQIDRVVATLLKKAPTPQDLKTALFGLKHGVLGFLNGFNLFLETADENFTLSKEDENEIREALEARLRAALQRLELHQPKDLSIRDLTYKYEIHRALERRLHLFTDYDHLAMIGTDSSRLLGPQPPNLL